ncbi:MAG: endonuclease, partial [Candidatus ainarchaeum sp.]|nr:endonuclease [Candidatus ainarchaeum sp.]
MNKLLSLYNSLLKKYGKQNWWPAETEYEIVVGALLTQNTNWRNVEKSIINLKKNNSLHPEKILKLNSNKLKELIKPSGFYNQKAPRLKELTKKYSSIKNKKLSIEKLREELLSVKGVGKETADSIILYAFNKPIFVIDAYTKRFCKFYNLFNGKNY